MKELTKDERSLLLFFEYTAVDQWGIIDDMRKMNNEDISIACGWNDEKFILFKKVHRNKRERIHLTFAVKLSDEAWKLAHQLRKEKALRHIPEELL